MRRAPDATEFQLVWQDVFDGAFLLLTCTRVDEIQAPIEAQVDAIERRSAQVFAGTMLLCVVGLVVISLSAVVVSLRLAGPVRSIVATSSAIVKNIGGDLFAGLRITGRRPDEPMRCRDHGEVPCIGVLVQHPGEVAQLQGEFLRSLFTLSRRRAREASPRSPFAGVGVPTGEGVPDAHKAAGAAGAAGVLYASVPFQPEKTVSEKARRARVHRAGAAAADALEQAPHEDLLHAAAAGDPHDGRDHDRGLHDRARGRGRLDGARQGDDGRRGAGQPRRAPTSAPSSRRPSSRAPPARSSWSTT